MKPGVGNVFLRISPKLPLFCLVAFASLTTSLAQGDISVGSWRFHLSYKNINQLTGSNETVFALGKNSLFYFSTNEQRPRTLSKLDGLYGHDFASIAFDPITKILLIAYRDGTLDLMSESKITRINDIRTNSLIDKKTIHKIRIINGTAWLSADFGVARINLAEGFIESAYLNLGPGGSSLTIKDIAIFQNQIYAVSETGVMRASLSSNLNDFNQWKRFDVDDVQPLIQVVGAQNGLFFLGEDMQVYFWNAASLDWVIGTNGITDLKISGELIYFSMDNGIYSLDQHGNMEIILSQMDHRFSDFHVTRQGIFIAAPDKGVWNLRENEGIYVNGPPSSLVNFVQTNGVTTAYSNATLKPQSDATQRQLGVFVSGVWDSWEMPEIILAVTHTNDITYIGTQNGLFQRKQETIASVKHALIPERAEIGALTTGSNGKIYIGINTPAPRLLIAESQDDIVAYDLDEIQTFEKIQVDRLGNCWILSGHATGGRLQQFNPQSGQRRTFSTQINNGGLPGQDVRDIFLDNDQNLWIATNQGIAYFFNAAGINTSVAVNAVLPIFENRIAMANTVTNQILIAPDRSIWIGTENQGLWHFGPEFEILIRNFTIHNSPIPASQMRSLALNEKTGELFVSTVAGSLSFRAESIRSLDQLGTLKIYPNPIRRDFNGVLSIEGLTDFSTLKIANTSGRVIASISVGGGKVTWNLRDPSGNRIAPGIYLVFVIDEAGRERTAGKFLVH
jgi:hypothetical protein